MAHAMPGPITDEARYDCSIQAYGVIDSMVNKNNEGGSVAQVPVWA